MKSEIKNLFPIIFSALILRILFDVINGIGIHYEEAQYWVWSQNPSLSYLTKGPFIANAIACITHTSRQDVNVLECVSLH